MVKLIQILLLASDPAGQESVLFENQIVNGFLTSEELAQVLRISIHTVRKWRKFETIPYRKFGRSVRFHLGDVLKALQNGA